MVWEKNLALALTAGWSRFRRSWGWLVGLEGRGEQAGRGEAGGGAWGLLGLFLFRGGASVGES